jgi:hypothetical protein
VRVRLIETLGLGVLLACASCAGATVGGGGSEAGTGDGGPAQADAQRDGQKDGPPQDDAGGGDDGGSCTVDDDEGFGNNDCAAAIDKGSLTDASSSHLSIIANLWPAGDVDWYKVTFVDTADTAGVCDPFAIRIAFAQNPGNNYLFDVSADDCTSAPTCSTGEVATGLTTFDYNDKGACPCVAGGADPPATDATTHLCIDHTMTLRIRVYRVVGAPVVCESYELSIDNG